MNMFVETTATIRCIHESLSDQQKFEKDLDEYLKKQSGIQRINFDKETLNL